MSYHRRAVLGAGLAAGAAVAATAAVAAGPRDPGRKTTVSSRGENGFDLGLAPGSDQDQTQRLQAAIDRLATTGTPLFIPPGRYRTGRLTLRAGTRIRGVAGASRLELAGPGPIFSGFGTSDVQIEGLHLDAMRMPLSDARSGAVVRLEDAKRFLIRDVEVVNSTAHGLSLTRAAGVVADCSISEVAETAIFSLDADGLEVIHNRIVNASNNGIQIWRSSAGEDGSIIAHNRIERVMALAGGTGQYGNGINVFRAGSVQVANNRITDCAYSAVRGNAASNIQILANSCQRLGEVALYAEFAFEGAMIANNLVDKAATGISVTNFNEGGRLAVIQGNLIRNLFRREYEPEDKRGEGIAVEADAVVNANVIENAPTAGIMIGWGAWMRDVAATSNVIRNARIGIAVSADPAAGTVLISANLISGAREGAIRGMQKATPVGPDLARTRIDNARVTISGNAVA